MEIAKLSASELAGLYRTKNLSPVDVAKDHLARRDRYEPQINAFVTRFDEEVLTAAKHSESRWQMGEPLSPLDGVPITIKDNLLVKGAPCRRGSAVSPAHQETEDSPVAARLRAAGTLLLGKTTMPEYGWKGLSDSPLTGLTRNPWDLAMTTGGSSAGAAACAALNIGCIHIGTDGAGSVRIPAAFTGVFGIKPTYGRVPAWPSSTMGFLAHLGPLTQTVEDSMRAMRVIAQPDARDMTAVLAGSMGPEAPASVKGMRIAWSPKLGGSVHLDPDVAALTEAAAKKFTELGAIVEQVDPNFVDPVDTLNQLWFAGAALILQSYTDEQKARMDPGLVAIAEAGAKMSSASYCEALLAKRNALAFTMARFHETYDLLLTPAMPLPAFKVGQLMPDDNRYGDAWTGWSPFTYPFNLTQQPASSVPCGLTRHGLPVGLQIVGRFGEDLTVLMASQAFESITPFARLSAPRGHAA